MEAEYVATCEVVKEAIWLRKFLTDLEVVPNMHLPLTLYYDNNAQLQIPKNLEVVCEESILSESTISIGRMYFEKM